jgi:WD40 repeat protein
MGLPGPIAFSTDGKQVALGCSQNTLHLYESGSGALLARLENPSESPLAAHPRFSPDGSYLAAGTECGAVYLWDLSRIRARLARLGVDWDRPPLPARRNAGRLTVILDPEPSSQDATPGESK